MKLTIERMGGFDIIESADVERIEVENKGVRVYMTDGTDVFAEREGHAESVATAAAIAARCGTLVEAIAARCGTLVEPLSEGPEVVTEAVMSDPSEVLVPPRNPRWDGGKRSKWAKGEPPRDGSTYVAREGGTSLCVRWDGKRWMAGGLPVVFGAGVEHRALGDGVAEGAGVRQWVDGDPPRDGRWYVGMWSNPLMRVVRWDDAKRWWCGTGGDEWGQPAPTSHWPTPIPER